MAHHKVFYAILLVFLYVSENFALLEPDIDLDKSDNDVAVAKPNAKLDQASSDYVCDTNQCQPGRDGRDGRDSIVPGPTGAPGARGPPGKPGTTGGSGGGSVYTRWGRKECPSGSTLLYQGVMGGSHYTHAGGGSNYLCMPLNPIFDKTIPGNQGYSYIYGTEYEMNAHAPLFPHNLHDHEAPCAVCFAESRGSQVMIPARNICPKDWTLEYKGYLMSDHIGHKRSQFVCVDSAPTSTLGTHANLNGALLYVVESHCGSLPCLPYKQGAELTCAVCTK